MPKRRLTESGGNAEELRAPAGIQGPDRYHPRRARRYLRTAHVHQRFPQQPRRAAPRLSDFDATAAILAKAPPPEPGSLVSAVENL
jgi:hypothetical protein